MANAKKTTKRRLTPSLVRAMQDILDMITKDFGEPGDTSAYATVKRIAAMSGQRPDSKEHWASLVAQITDLKRQLARAEQKLALAHAATASCGLNDPKTTVPMLLWCPDPKCNARHVDKGEFATRVHHTHSCQTCGHTWRPAVVPTVGVQFLPGFKDEP